MTWLFWFIAIVMVVLALAFIVPPLLKLMPGREGQGREARLAVYRKQFAELEQDVKTGVLSEEHYQEAKHELARRILEETEEASPSPEPRGGLRPKVIVGLLLLLVPLASVGLYLMLGNPFAMRHPTVPNTRMAGEPPHQTAGGIDVLAEGLKKKLEAQPDNASGWALLARSYVELGRHAEAIPAFERAVELGAVDAQLLADFADALGMVHGRKLEGKPAKLIEQALALDPQNVKALLLAATVAYDRQDLPKAIEYWNKALKNEPPDSELSLEVQANLNDANARLGKPTRPLKISRANTSRPSGEALTGTVRLAPALEGKAKAGDTLFVFARAVAGPPMPVAIIRATGGDLPFTFRLDDTKSVMPTRTLSQVDQVLVVARISQTGEATPHSGDLEGRSEPVRPGTSGLTIVIDRVIP